MKFATRLDIQNIQLKEIFVDRICSGTQKSLLRDAKKSKSLCFSLAAKDAPELNVCFTSEVLEVTRWTTAQQTAMETSAEKGKMLENLTATILI